MRHVPGQALGVGKGLTQWAEAELGHAQLGDARRSQRLTQLAAALAARPNVSIPEACGSAAASKAAYRFFDTATDVPELPKQVLAAHCQRTKQQLADQPVVLAVQDTTTLDWSQHPATTGLGPVTTSGRQQGLLVHSTLAVSLSGLPLGLLDQQVWAREAASTGQRHQRRSRAVADKESQKWLSAVSASQAGLPDGVQLVHVGDREADVYDLFLAAEQQGAMVLIRAAQDRRTATPAGRLRATLEQLPEADRQVRRLPRSEDRPARPVTLALRWATVTLQPPKHRATERLAAVVLDAVLVQQLDPAPGEPAIEWLLLTSVPIDDLASAWQRVDWYTYRWRIERYHLVLKSGCRIEARQLATAARLRCCLAVFAVVACWLLRLTYAARESPDAPATDLLTNEEYAVLWAARHPAQPTPPQPEPTLREAVREIAGLGGFLGRRHDGEPGVITLWRGCQRLRDLLHGYHLTLLPKNVGNE
jgi:hypothetical protein